MSLRQRRFLYLSFILLFLAAAPVIALYASGWRYNLRLAQWQNTGGLVVTAFPREAKVELDRKQVGTGRVVRARYLLPGGYQLRVATEGYKDWTSQVTVRAGQTEFVSGIELFFKNPQPIFINQLPLGLANATSTSLRINDWQLSLVDGSGDDLSTVSLVANHTITNESNITLLPAGEYYLSRIGEQAIVYNQQNHNLFIYSIDQGSGQLSGELVTSLALNWQVMTPQLLLYHNSFEIWVFNIVERESSLVTRLGSGIDDVARHNRGQYIYYLTDNEIRSLKLSQNNEYYEESVLRLPEIHEFIVQKDTGYLYVNARIGSQAGWFEVAVQ